MASRPLDSSHSDYPSVSPIVEAILEAAGGLGEFEVEVPIILRTAIDEVIDAPRTKRFLLSETEKTEKTYLGTKVEILIRAFLGFSKGSTLDMNVKGAEVDIKNTMQANWSIPRENLGRPALLIRSNEVKARCDIGVAVIHDEYLRRVDNRDSKRGIAAAKFDQVWWILWDHPYPVNFWMLMTAAERLALMKAGGGKLRLAALFEKIQGRPISRTQVLALAQQLDPMKRIRRNGGARDVLAPKGIAILSGKVDHVIIAALGIGPVTREEFISYTPKTAAEAQLLRDADHID